MEKFNRERRAAETEKLEKEEYDLQLQQRRKALADARDAMGSKQPVSMQDREAEQLEEQVIRKSRLSKARKELTALDEEDLQRRQYNAAVSTSSRGASGYIPPSFDAFKRGNPNAYPR